MTRRVIPQEEPERWEALAELVARVVQVNAVLPGKGCPLVLCRHDIVKARERPEVMFWVVIDRGLIAQPPVRGVWILMRIQGDWIEDQFFHGRIHSDHSPDSSALTSPPGSPPGF